ncbi:hypothetical protein M153_3100012030 [Pseudoloma neurophilia]|uniref:Uncharacterized protein n=1 Tax=Pseudoloma neurophilia TaxID=146866 RepID=A0A0R0M4Q1_9MICR|nr:hypothetical protein M153_3100012030 [Pseudoloma neurophilia]
MSSTFLILTCFSLIIEMFIKFILLNDLYYHITVYHEKFVSKCTKLSKFYFFRIF